MMENISPEKAETEELHHAMDRAKNAPSSENIHHLIKKLQEKLDNNGGSEDHNHHHLFVPSLHGHADSGRLPSLLSNNNSTSHFDENLVENQADGAPRDKQHLPTDTIVLVGSLIVMIFIGLIFHRIISYLAKLRSRRRQYQMGLKQLGEHMHVVTRTMSNPPSATNTPVATPSISLRKLAHLNTSNNNNNNNNTSLQSLPNISNNNKKGTLGAVAALHSSALHAHHQGHHSSASSSYMGSPSGSISIAEVRQSRPSIAGDFTIPDDDNSVFKPSTHVMRREDSALGTLATAAQLRHKELHVHHYDDGD